MIKMKQKDWFWFMLIFGMILLARCAIQPAPIANAPIPSATIQANDLKVTETQVILSATATATATAMPIPTLTDTSTPTQTVTATLVPTQTKTPTLAPSPTPNSVVAGSYPVGICIKKNMPYKSTYEFCVNGVTVNRNRHMIVTVTQTISGIPNNVTVTKRSDAGNKNMYMIDNLGNRYDHIGGGGSTYSSIKVNNGEPMRGWFEFNAPPEGAFLFSFYDDDNHIVITGIDLKNPVIVDAEYTLNNYPLVVVYRKDVWDQVEKDGQKMLVNKKLPTCTLEDRPAGEPQGTLKNRIEIGKLTYDIYGYLEQDKNLGVREYLLVKGIEGLDANLKPFFLVNIPLDNSADCINAANAVLENVEMR